MPSVVTLEELSKRPTKELMKMFYLNEKEAKNLRAAVRPERYEILTSTDLDIEDMAEKFECSYGHVIEQRCALRKVDFETFDRRGLKLPEERGFIDAVYERLDKKPYLMAAFQLHEDVEYPPTGTAFNHKLSKLQKESEEMSELYPELLIRKEVLSLGTRWRSKNRPANHRSVFGNLPPQPVYFLQKNIHKAGETLALGDVNSIVHRQNISKDLRMAVLRADTKRRHKTDISKTYHALTKEPLGTTVIAKKAGLKRSAVDSLRKLEKLGLAKETEECVWVRTG